MLLLPEQGKNYRLQFLHFDSATPRTNFVLRMFGTTQIDVTTGVGRHQSIAAVAALNFPSHPRVTGKRAASPKLTAKQMELAQVESEIEKLLDTLTGATPVLISYANAKIEELDSRRQTLASEIAKLTAEAVSPEQIDTISNYLDDWENVSFEDKQQVVDLMITVIRATSEKLQIEWKI